MHHKSIQFKYIDFVCVEEDVETVFAVPVLLSGLASLVLTAKEEKMLGQHHKVHLQRLLRLHQATPEPVVFFLAGCLPIQAQLHLRIFAMFGQLCRLREADNILANHALHVPQLQVLVLEVENTVHAVWTASSHLLAVISTY